MTVVGKSTRDTNRSQINTFSGISSSIVDFNEQVKSYATWLAKDSRRNSASSRREEIKRYTDDALSMVKLRGKDVSLFAPFRRQFSALQTVTRGQFMTLGVMLLAVGVLELLVGLMGIAVAAIAVITALYLGDLIVYMLLSLQTLNLSAEEQIDDAIVHALANADWPYYTILCPLYHETEVVPQFVRAMQALDYPNDRLQILLLTEEDDVATRQAIQALRLPPHFTVVTVPTGEPRTKPRACNYGLLQAQGEYVVIYDAEDVPDPLQLKKAVLTFANQSPETACVQAKLNFYNTEQNLLTRWFTAEYSLWFDLTLPGLQKLGVPLPLGGTSNHFRTHMLRSLGAWDAFNVTEDCDLGLRMAFYGLKTAVLNSTTYEEANSRLKNWIRQRSRWIKGYMQTYLVYMRQPHIYLRKERWGEFLSLQLIVGGKTAVLFVNPFMWALLAIYIALRPVNLYHVLFPPPILYMAALCLIFGNFFYTYIHLIGCIRRGYYNLVKWTLLIPIYWAMASLAAFMALYQLIFKPHYWEKTEHGLHLRTFGPILVTEEETKVWYQTLPLPDIENRVQPREFGVVATSWSSNISLTTEEFELEVTRKILRMKRQPNAEFSPVPARTVAPNLEEDTLPDTPLPGNDDAEEEDITAKQPALKRLPDTPRPEHRTAEITSDSLAP